MNYVSTVTGTVDYARQTASQIAASTDPRVFQGWPEAVRARFVQNNGTGTPPAVVVGPAGGRQVLATLSADGVGVTASELPADFAADPHDLAPDAFAAWSTDLQLFYVKANLGGAASLAIGPEATAIEAALSFDGDGVVISGGAALDSAYAPYLTDPSHAPGGGSPPTDFLSWPRDAQYRYFQLYGTAGGVLDFGSPAAPGIPVRLDHDGAAYTVLTSAAQLAAAQASGFTAAAGVSSDAFAAWPRELQRAYVEAVADKTVQGAVAYPATAVMRGAGEILIASVASRGSDVDSVAAPAGFAAALAGAPPSLETFTGWPEAAQLAFARAALSSSYRALQLYSSSPAAGTPSALVVARDAASASGIALTPVLGSVAQTADLALLHLLSPGDLQTYLQRNGTGTPPAVVLGQRPSQFIVTAGTDPAQPGVAIQPLPAAAGDPAASISSSDFLRWTPEVENYVFARDAIGTPPVMLLGDGKLATAYAGPSDDGYTVDAAPSALTILATADAGAAATFAGWPAAAQTWYFARNATGTPSTLLLGRAGQQTLVSPSASPAWTGDAASDPDRPFRTASGLLAKSLPPGFGTPAAGLDAATFLGWPAEVRSAYLTGQGSGVPKALQLASSTTPGSGVLTVTRDGVDPYRIAIDVDTGRAPTDADLALIRLLPPAELRGFLAQRGSGSPRSVLIGTATPTLLTASTDPADATPTFIDLKKATASAPNGIATLPADLDAGVFAAWPPAVQAYYFAQNATGTPPLLVVGREPKNRVLVMAASEPGQAGLVRQAYPEAASGPVNRVTGTTFSSWTAPVQAAFFAAHATGTPPTLLVGRSDALSLVSAVGATGLAFTVEAYPSAKPDEVTPDMLGTWSDAVVDAYATRNGKGGLHAFVIDKAGTPLLVSQQAGQSRLGSVVDPTDPTKTVISNQTRTKYVVQTAAAERSTIPAALSVPTFLGWTPEMRAYYIATQGSGTPKTVTFGTGFAVTATATDPAGAYAIPYLQTYGGPNGTDISVNTATANALFPVYDGKTTFMTPKPAAFTTAPAALDPVEFAKWNTAIQLEYIHTNIGAAESLAIGNATLGYNDVFIGGPKGPTGYGTVVYTAQNLLKQDIAKMSLADQTTLTGVTRFVQVKTGLAAGLGLIPDGTVATTAGEARTYMTTLITNAKSRIDHPLQDLGAAAPAALTVDGAMSDADKKVFSDQLDILSSELDGSAVFSPNDVNQQISAILTRYTRANAFSASMQPQGSFSLNKYVAYETNSGGTLVANSVTFDGGLTASALGYPDRLTAPVGNYSNGNNPTYENVNAGNTDFQNYWGTDSNILNALKASGAAGLKAGTSAVSGGDVGVKSGGVTVYHYTDGGNSVDGKDHTKSTIENTMHIVSAAYDFKPGTLPADQVTSYQQSYKLLMGQETQILQLQTNGLTLATAGNIKGADGKILTKNLDLPNLIYLFQLYANLTGEANIRANTEEINQTNNLLKLYGLMQQIVNATVKGFSGDDNKQSPPNSHNIATAPDADTQAQWNAAIAMFGTAGGLASTPIEILQGISRPRNDLTASLDSQQWSTIGTQLSDTVTLLNQNSQLKMNDINTQTKQKDRNFDLANSALSKMYDNLQKILGAS